MAEEMKSVDQATLKMLEKAKADKVSTVFDRAEDDEALSDRGGGELL